MRRHRIVLAATALAIGLHADARAETSCELAGMRDDTVVTVRGKITSSDWDRVHNSYLVVIELRDRCGVLEVQVSTKRSPRCGVGATVSVTGPYSRADGPSIEAQRVVCLK